ncbi:3-phosphoshikimate 1-carboxyvinyltransferase [Ekhidna sp. To15]|uniref:3-phosphoshikimate 1-carboxyvinyltransferase n=1 Tax=Ekhidna sp. To15 TaxID=3395267 RepID=UPI003F5286B1
MKNRLKKHNKRLKSVITLESSKSESNRALIINALAGGEIENITNLSNARDTQTMQQLLQDQPNEYDVKDAGTTMRFLTAYLAIQGQDAVITGTDRMKQRPIGPLVDALRELGAEIEYLEKDGYPPLKVNRIKGQASAEISIPGNISSQYISALLMISPCLPKGLTVTLTTEIFSGPYIQMTLDLMKAFGVNAQWTDRRISISPQIYRPTSYAIEGDWSGASYWYGFMALAKTDSTLKLPGVRKNSSQGDQAIVDIMGQMGIATDFESEAVVLTKKEKANGSIRLDFRARPDLAQTVMVVAAASGIQLQMTGLESLKIKETDRIMAMKNELEKIGASLQERDGEWILTPSLNLPNEVSIDTYEDHRMAMAFAPLSLLMDVTIEDPMVVNKSYPRFWEEVKKLGVEILS